MFKKKVTDPMEIKDDLVRDLTHAFGQNLLSVIIFGSAVTPRYRPGISDINLIIVVRDDSVSLLSGLNPLEKKWAGKSVVFSFFFTPDYIRNSLDSYPLEFLEIKNDHKLLFGTDYFTGLTISPSLLRLQCERELKGKLLHLKREYLRRRHQKGPIRELLRISFAQFLIIFRGILHFAGTPPVPYASEEICALLGRTLNLNVSALERIAALKIPGSAGEFDALMLDYISLIDHITRAIDQLRAD